MFSVFKQDQGLIMIVCKYHLMSCAVTSLFCIWCRIKCAGYIYC